MEIALPQVDLTGLRFGKLTVSGFVGKAPNGSSIWHCSCDCGGTTTARTSELNAGRRQSCRCGLSKPKHGMHGTRLHRIWSAMKSRCSDPKKLSYADYGGRGIYVAEEFQQFIPFMIWALANGYHENLQIDRRDNDGPYSPSNCHWITRAENMKNRRPQRPPGLRYTIKEIECALRRAEIDPAAVIDLLPKKRGYR